MHKVDWKILQGHALTVLKDLSDESVHCVVTSPPYYGLRDYGTPPQIWGGNEFCDHVFIEEVYTRRSNDNKGNLGFEKQRTNMGTLRRDNPVRHGFCIHCDAWLGSLGLEPTPELFIKHLVLIFREVWRVLRKDGTCFVNLGDSYWGGKGKSGSQGKEHQQLRVENGLSFSSPQAHVGGKNKTRPTDSRHPVFKPKDLMMMPHRVAIALQEDGWWVRQDIVWSKKNPMPESVKDRCTNSHEYIFQLAKSKKYYFDHYAISEDCSPNTNLRISKNLLPNRTPRKGVDSKGGNQGKGGIPIVSLKTLLGDSQYNVKNNSSFASAVKFPVARRNKRSVWTTTIPKNNTNHFATFSTRLIEPCILAGTSEKGCCADCGAPYKRITKKEFPSRHSSRPQTRRAFEIAESGGLTEKHFNAIRSIGFQDAGQSQLLYTGFGNNAEETQKLADEAKRVLGGYFREFLLGEVVSNGWQKTCKCLTDEIAPCVVMDIFNGTATTGESAISHKRSYIGIELNPKDIKNSQEKLSKVQVKLF